MVYSFSLWFVRRGLEDGFGAPAALKLDECAVEPAVEHVLVAYELEDLVGGGQGCGEGLAGPVELWALRRLARHWMLETTLGIGRTSFLYE